MMHAWDGRNRVIIWVVNVGGVGAFRGLACACCVLQGSDSHSNARRAHEGLGHTHPDIRVTYGPGQAETAWPDPKGSATRLRR